LGLGPLSYTSVFGDGPNGSASVSGNGSTFELAIGGTIAPGIALAGVLGGVTVTSSFNGGPFRSSTIMTPGASGTVHATGDAAASLFEIGILLDWFPNPSKGLHFGGSLGIGGTGVRNQADGSTYGGFGGTASLFGGYDFWIGPSWSSGIGLVAWGATPREEMKDSSGNDTGYRLTPLSIGLQLSLLYY
jgi:hypothetical protein